MSHCKVPDVVKQDNRGDTHEIVDRLRAKAAPVCVLDIVIEDVFVAMHIQRSFAR
jgi:hypothetical protein